MKREKRAPMAPLRDKKGMRMRRESENLIAPLPVEAANDAGAGHQVLEHLVAHQTSLASQVGLGLARRPAQVLAHARHLAVQFQTRHGQVVRLARGVLAHLLQTHVPPALHTHTHTRRSRKFGQT